MFTQAIIVYFMLIGCTDSLDNNQNPSTGQLTLSISAQKQNLVITWRDLVLQPNATIMLMNSRLDGGGQLLLEFTPDASSAWMETNLRYNYTQFRDLVDVNTTCYGYWVYYRNADDILTNSCLRAYPRWMAEIKDHIKESPFRDLFVPGSHDSASYKDGFDPAVNETLVSKYTLTQDDDIASQLLHGIRYLDIRVGYYRRSEPQFWANHGISRQQPLNQVLRSVYDFVRDTNEIVVMDFQEFPVGFGRNFAIHQKLVAYIKAEIGDMVVDLQDTWRSRLAQIWAQHKRIIICYDHISVVEEFHPFTWMSTQQRWANTANRSDLKVFLNRVNADDGFRYSPRPVTDMAELTPDPWGVISDRYGGLRKMSDAINNQISEWYFKEFGATANFVAVDFYRGTTIVQAAIYWNVYRSQLRTTNAMIDKKK